MDALLKEDATLSRQVAMLQEQLRNKDQEHELELSMKDTSYGGVVSFLREQLKEQLDANSRHLEITHTLEHPLDKLASFPRLPP